MERLNGTGNILDRLEAAVALAQDKGEALVPLGSVWVNPDEEFLGLIRRASKREDVQGDFVKAVLEQFLEERGLSGDFKVGEEPVSGTYWFDKV